MAKIQGKRIVSEYPWEKTAEWDRPSGKVAVLSIDGHILEVHKKPYLFPKNHAHVGSNEYNPPKTFRFWLVVDGVPRGGESPRVSQIITEADAMVSWARATA